MRTATANREIIKVFFADAKNYNKVRAMCRRVFKNHEDAEDALHDIFLKLYNNAARISFPEHPEEALAYLHDVINNAFYDACDKAKHRPRKANEEDVLELAEDESLSDPVKLELVDIYVHTHPDLFTPVEVKLWESIYLRHSTEEKERIFGKTGNNLYVMRFNLLAKIHRCMAHDDLI